MGEKVGRILGSNVGLELGSMVGNVGAVVVVGSNDGPLVMVGRIETDGADVVGSTDGAVVDGIAVGLEDGVFEGIRDG